MRNFSRLFFLILLILFWFFPVSLSFSQSVTFSINSIAIDIPNTNQRLEREFLMDLLVNTAHAADTIFPEDFSFTVNRSQTSQSQNNKNSNQTSSYSIAISAAGDSENQVLTVRVSGGGASRPKDFTYLGSWRNLSAIELAKLSFYLINALNDFQSIELEEPPVLVYAYEPRNLNLPKHPFMSIITPLNVEAVGPDELLIAASSFALKMTSDFAFIDTLEEDAENPSYSGNAYYVRQSDAGIVYFMDAIGDQLIQFLPGAPRPIRLRNPVNYPARLEILEDGSLIVSSSIEQNAVRIQGRQIQELDIFPNEYYYLSTYAAGPENTIWAYDFNGRVLIYNTYSELLNVIYPFISEEFRSSVKDIDVYPDGSFTLLTHEGLYKFDSTGKTIWIARENELPDLNFTILRDVDINPETGFIYYVDMLGRKIGQLLDRQHVEANNITIDHRQELIEISELLLKDPDDVDLFRRRANYFESRGSLESAMVEWDKVLNFDPYDGTAIEHLEALEITKLINQANLLHEKTLDILTRVGVETARSDYQRTLQFYEQILSRDPDNSSIALQKSRLEEAFENAGDFRTRNRAILVGDVAVEDIFPSLTNLYTGYGIGTAEFVNNLDVPIEQVSLFSFIPNYMNFEAQTNIIGRVNPGETVSFRVPLSLNEKALTLTETVPTQIGIRLNYRINGEIHETRTAKTVTMHKRTALTWDDSNKLASFIMPNEDVVTGFALRSADTQSSLEDLELPEKFLRAIRIAESLGAYNINYIEDPSAPITEILGSPTFVDTVRFPRMTLHHRSGDCDDTTALLSSLFEAAGLQTAIMTSPGHVFLAVDTGEPRENEWIFNVSGYETIIYNNTIWIPIETTNLNEGFFESWKYASNLVKIHEPEGNIEFLPVQIAHETYPSLNIPGASYQIVEPAPEIRANRYATQEVNLENTLYRGALSNLQSGLNSTSGRRRLALLNRIAVLHSRFGKHTEAINVLQEAIDMDNRFLASYVNLGNIYISQGQLNQAVEVIEQGRAIRPESPLLNLLMAQAFHAMGNQEQVNQFLTAVEEKNPELAGRFSFLLVENTAARASSSQEERPLIWIDEAE